MHSRYLCVSATDTVDLVERVDITPTNPQSSTQAADMVVECAIATGTACMRTKLRSWNRFGAMDQAQKWFYRLLFRNAYLEKKGDEFQNWFCQLAAHVWGSDFERVRPYGSQGDFKCDGRRISTGTIFQCHAQRTLRAAELNKKIREDFGGALAHWPDMAEWIFVFNGNDGLPPSTSQLLDELRAEHEEIDISLWTEPALQELAERMRLHGWESVFGPVPSQSSFESLALEDLQPVVDKLARDQPEPGEEPLDPPSAEKLERNALSDEAAGLLKLGRRKEAMVEKYFQNEAVPDLGEQIAEAFRRRYANLAVTGQHPDQIFSNLQRFAGGMEGSPARQGAVLAVLSYYFERCDIFEDADVEAA